MEVNYDICQMLDEKMMEYSAYTILHRALPSLEDGFKPSQRRILYTMHRHNMNKLTKSASVSGKVMEIHPHSDSYPTMVNMVQKDNHANPFIIGKGAFAYATSRDTQPASSRYTEIRIAPYSQEMMEGLKKNSVEMMPTFDGNSLEPRYLPSKHCNLLTMCQQGMGVGMACNFPSFNINEVCDYTISYINSKSNDILVPDFPTGGKIIHDKTQIQRINDTGQGSIQLLAQYETKNDYILIREIPYTTTREQCIEKIIELSKQGKLKEVVDIIDTTDIKGMEIEIKVRKNVDKDILMKKLYALTPLQSSFSANMNCLVGGSPKVLGVKDIVSEWVIFRKQCIKNEISYDIENNKKELNKLEGLKIILSDLDKAIAIIRSSKSEKDAMDNLIAHFKLNLKQAEYISSIRLMSMNEEWLNSRISKLKGLAETVTAMQTNLNNDTYISNVIIAQLQEVKEKYGQPRRTEIICESEVDVSDDLLVEDYNCQIVLTEQGYLKKTLRYSDTQRTKEDDKVAQQVQSTNKSKLLLFTDKTNCYYLNVHELDTTLPSNLGDYLPTLLQLQDEQILYVVSTEDYKGHMLFAFENGKVAKVNLSSYETKTNRTRVVNAYNANSKLISIHYIENDCDFIAISSIDKVLVFDTNLINAKDSKSSQGVNVLKSKDDSKMVLFKPCEIEDDDIKNYYKVNIPAVGKYSRKDF